MSGNEGDVAPWGPAGGWRTITLVAMALAATIVLAALVITLGEANRQRDRALALQAHSYDVMNLARVAQGSIAQSEASLGRYVISGDQTLGQLYFDEWRRADEAIDRLELLTNDNDGQRGLVRELRAAYAVRGAELAATALNTNYGKNSQALARYYQLRRAPALATLNTALDRIIRNERALLERRTSRAMATARRSTGAAMVLSVFGVLLVLGMVLLGWAMMRALSDRAVARAEAEAERARADELAEAVRRATEELREQEGRLRQVQKMEAVGQLTGGIAHDFNNMLAVVIGGLELARRNLATGGDTLRHLESAEEGARRAAALTQRLLAFSRETAINPECIGAADLFAGMADLLDRTLGDGIIVVFRDDSNGWRTRVDRVQLENTLVNLAVNARDAMEGRGRLTVDASTHVVAPGDDSAGTSGEYLALAVTDTGCGMSPELIERVFEPFFTTKPVGKGTGLGLSQIFAFARQVGGDVTLRSAPGEGTTVTLLLPRDMSVPLSAPSTANIDPSPAPFPATGPSTAALRVLVVEDDARVLAATVGALEELGHEVVRCDDPLLAAERLAAAGPVDLILSDVLMPGRTGPQMVASLPPAYAHVPVLFVTGFAGDAAAGNVDLGGRPVLRKPFTLAGLENAIASIAGGQAEAIAAE